MTGRGRGGRGRGGRGGTKTSGRGRGGSRAPKRSKLEELSSEEEESNDDSGAESDTPADQVLVSGIDEDDAEEIVREFKVGRLLICGGTDWDMVGRKDLPKSASKDRPTGGTLGKNLWGPHVWSSTSAVRIKGVFSSSASCHSVLITEDGRVMTWGRNEKGQLGTGDLVTRYEPTELEGFKNKKFIGAACGRGHTLFLTDKGVVYSCGDNKMNQLGIGSKTPVSTSPVRINYTGKPIQQVACGAEFSMILDVTGGLFSFGSPEFGQLGHNTEGKHLLATNKVAFSCQNSPKKITSYIEKTREGQINRIENVSIVNVACGVNHAIALDSEHRCYTWGFGGYGRLGHSDTKNELLPRILKTFEYMKCKIDRVYAGSTFCLATSGTNLVYFWGQNKPAGEATVYPKPVQDLSGWKIRSVGCANKSIVVVADNSVISWGPSPTYGELGYGENKAKSSTTPQEMKTLEKIYVHEVACGFGHTIMICREDNEEEKEIIDKLPAWP